MPGLSKEYEIIECLYAILDAKYPVPHAFHVEHLALGGYVAYEPMVARFVLTDKGREHLKDLIFHSGRGPRLCE